VINSSDSEEKVQGLVLCVWQQGSWYTSSRVSFFCCKVEADPDRLRCPDKGTGVGVVEEEDQAIVGGGSIVLKKLTFKVFRNWTRFCHCLSPS
jgi:hypothetical protein